MDKLVLKEDLKPVFDLLNDDDINAVVDMKAELVKTYNTAQIFRTETEMRVSVLNDHNLPDKASKFWQCVREQDAQFGQVMQASFQLRRLDVKKQKLEHEYDSADYFRKLEIDIELDEMSYGHANLERTVKDRIRELKLWSQLKSELDDGSFDTNDVNNSQLDSLTLKLQNRQKYLTPNSDPNEIANVAGPLATANKLKANGDKLIQTTRRAEIGN
jgi:hypothetical protein